MKKFKAVFEIEIDDGKKLREAWKKEGYDNLQEFLEDYMSDISDDLIETFIDFYFDVKKFKFVEICSPHKKYLA